MNIMTMAWEIAHKGSARFGGSAKDYIGESLKIAWKMSRTEHFGFEEVRKIDGALYFAVEDVEGLQVALLYDDINLYTRKACVGRNNMSPYRTGENKLTHKRVRIYQVGLQDKAVELRVGNRVEILNINRGNLQWA